MILQNNAANFDVEMQIAAAIVIMQCGYGGDGDFDRADAKWELLAHGNIRDVLKFYSKRLPCSCLKEQYKHSRRTVPKMGLCEHCRQRKERAILMTCGQCKVPQYCSRECQVAEWPDHEKDCDRYANIRRRREARTVGEDDAGAAKENCEDEDEVSVRIQGKP